MSTSIWRRPAVLVTLAIVVIALIVVGVATRSTNSAPSAPQSVHAVAGDASVAVSWSAPAKDGGSAVTHYRASASPGGKWCTASTMSCTITGLTNGTAYTISVTATNTVGTSVAATSSSVTPKYAACVAFSNLPARPVAADVLATLTAYYTANHLVPISVVNNREMILNVAEQTIGVHHCTNPDGSVAGYTGMVPASATAAVEVEVRHLAYPVTGGSISFVILAQTAAGWKVVNEGTGP
jgi:hypothetical protein